MSLEHRQGRSLSNQNQDHDAAGRPRCTPSFPLPHQETSRVATWALAPAPHLGWCSRGYLPHWDHPGMVQSLNFRLADAVPAKLVAQWIAELQIGSLARPRPIRAEVPIADPATAKQNLDPDGVSARRLVLMRRIQKYEDAGYGACWLHEPRFAELVENALLYFDGQRYRLIGWCIMPNHVHVIIETTAGHPLSRVVHAWKSYTAAEARRMLGRTGPFWFREYFDRYVRSVEHFQRILRYVEENPVKAGLVRRSVDWRFGSAWRRAEPASWGGSGSGP